MHITNGRVALQLLGSMLEEGDDVSQRLLDTILKCLVTPQKDDNPAARRWSFVLYCLDEWILPPVLISSLDACSGFYDSAAMQRARCLI